MKLFKAIAVVLALAMAFWVTLLVSGKRVLVAETKVSPGDTYVVAEYGDLGKSNQGALVCRYYTGRSILTKVFWYSSSNIFGRDQCPFILSDGD